MTIACDIVPPFGITKRVGHLQRLHRVVVLRLGIKALIFLACLDGVIQFFKGILVEQFLHTIIEL